MIFFFTLQHTTLVLSYQYSSYISLAKKQDRALMLFLTMFVENQRGTTAIDFVQQYHPSGSQQNNIKKLQHLSVTSQLTTC